MIIDAISGVGGGGGGTTIVQKPTVSVGTYTYDGTAQGPTITGFDSSKMTISGDTATNAGSYTLTIGLKNTNSMVWNDMTTADLTWSWSIGKVSVAIPTVTDTSKTYNGSAQSPTITGFDSTTMLKSGDSATDAGDYTLSISLQDTTNYEWSDTTIAAKTTAWSIAKANQIITLSSNSITLDSSHLTATVTVSGAQGSLSVSSSDTSIATASISGSTVTINNVNRATGTATITVSAASTTNYNAGSATISVSAEFLPNGSTVTPTDDVQTWLSCAGITDKSYTTINQVLSDTSTLSTLISSNNAANYMARSTTWASSVCANQNAMSYIGLNNYCANALLANSTWLNAICNSSYFESVLNVKVPTMTSNTTPRGKAFSRTIYTSDYDAYHAFDGNLGANSGQKWNSASPSEYDYLGYQFTTSVVINKVWFLPTWTGSNLQLKEFKIQGSNDNSTWVDLTEVITLNNTQYSNGYNTGIINSTGYLYYRIYCISSYQTKNFSINEVQFYGREEA